MFLLAGYLKVPLFSNQRWAHDKDYLSAKFDVSVGICLVRRIEVTCGKTRMEGTKGPSRIRLEGRSRGLTSIPFDLMCF